MVTKSAVQIAWDFIDLLWDFYRKTKDEKWLKFLINRNDINALAEYCNLAKECMSPPKMGQYVSAFEVSDAIRTVYKIGCLEPLNDLLKLSGEAGFSDKTEAGFGLNNACWKGISNIAIQPFFQQSKQWRQINKTATANLKNELAISFKDWRNWKNILTMLRWVLIVR